MQKAEESLLRGWEDGAAILLPYLRAIWRAEERLDKFDGQWCTEPMYIARKYYSDSEWYDLTLDEGHTKE